MREEMTDTLRLALHLACVEARGHKQEFVGTEHVLLGLLEANHSEVCKALSRHEIDAKHVARGIRNTLPRGTVEPVVTGDLPLSPKAQRLITESIVLAQRAQDTVVSTRYLMQAILANADGLGERAMRDGGMDVDELQRLLSEKPAEREP